MSVSQTSVKANERAQARKRVCLVDTLPQFDHTADVKLKAADQLFYRQFGQLLADVRRKKGISQELLADELGLSRTSITNIEKGRQPIQLHSLYRVARRLEVELKELLPSPQLFESPRVAERLSVSRSEWLETMNVSLPKGLLNAPKRHRTHSPKNP